MLVLGTDLSFAHEGMDAPNVSLPLGQSALLKAVLAVVEAPLVVVMLSAQPLDISALLQHPMVGAVIHAGQPSIQTMSIGDIIFGKRAPAGRLVQTVYPASFVASLSMFDMKIQNRSEM